MVRQQFPQRRASRRRRPVFNRNQSREANSIYQMHLCIYMRRINTGLQSIAHVAGTRQRRTSPATQNKHTRTRTHCGLTQSRPDDDEGDDEGDDGDAGNDDEGNDDDGLLRSRRCGVKTETEATNSPSSRYNVCCALARVRLTRSRRRSLSTRARARERTRSLVRGFPPAATHNILYNMCARICCGRT